MFSWPMLKPAPFSTSLLRLDISSFSWLIVSFALTALEAFKNRKNHCAMLGVKGLDEGVQE